MRKIIFILLFCFFNYTFADSHGNIEVKTVVKSTKSWNGKLLEKYPKGQPEVTILDITIPAHSKLKWHKHPVINAGILVKGSLSVISEDGKKLKLKEGDSIVELINTWHYGENGSDTPAQIIVFYAGIKDMPITIIKNDK